MKKIRKYKSVRGLWGGKTGAARGGKMGCSAFFFPRAALPAAVIVVRSIDRT